ncbi:hypothetical protein PIB30_002712 [Stylosanthes scabra]|uniref:Uncharacterized protein n=1 Tax=Stylosanthes scabra TaxID=79078 RepID=A0ABU6R3N2_9FABA|nr:hypothetical protein [Stylosanthes scabra]
MDRPSVRASPRVSGHILRPRVNKVSNIVPEQVGRTTTLASTQNRRGRDELRVNANGATIGAPDQKLCGIEVWMEDKPFFLFSQLTPRKRRRKKAKVDEAFEKALGDDSAWEHDVDPLQVAFLESFNYRKALNAGLTSAPVREALSKMPPEQLLGESYHLSTKSLACLQVGVETSLAAKVKAEKELSAALNQIEVLKGERDSALLYLPLKENVNTLDDQLSERTAEYRSALDRIALLEEDNRVLKT